MNRNIQTLERIVKLRKTNVFGKDVILKVKKNWQIAKRKTYFTIASLIPTIFFVLLIFSCNPFSPDYEKFEHSLSTGDNSSIDGLMKNFVYAYTYKDSFLYETLLDSSFTFKYYNSEIPETWNRDEDLKITNKMFRNMTSLNLVFNSEFPDSNCIEYKDSITIITSFNLSLSSGMMVDEFVGFSKFRFRKNYNEIDEECEYKIYYWEDLR